MGLVRRGINGQQRARAHLLLTDPSVSCSRTETDVAQLRFDIPAYERAMSDFAASVMNGLAARHPVIGDIPVRRTIHPGPTRNVPGPQPVDHPLSRVEQRVEFHTDVIRYSQIEEFISILAEISRHHQDVLERELVRTVTDVCDATGNVIDAQGRPLTFDLILELVEKLEIRFDEAGMMSKPVIMMHPDNAERLRQNPPTPEQLQQLNEILRRKRAEQDAQKRTRRLSG